MNNAAPDNPAPEQEQAPAAKQERTPGLRLFDLFLYPFLTNFGVFMISVAATYLTSRGDNPAYGKVGQFFHKRGEWLVNKFQGVGMNESQAEMSKMVFFSYVDGSLLAPVVKKFEDNREDIGRWVDHRLGTEPADDSVYKAEPKQSWGSVMGGRFATCAIVVPTAVALEKAGLNDMLFSNPGKKLGEMVANRPHMAKHFGSLDVPELGKIGAFEAFYTSVCTAGLYFSSRLFAKMFNSGKPNDTAAAPSAPATPGDAVLQETPASGAPVSAPIATQQPLISAAPQALEANRPQSRISMPPGSISGERVMQHEHGLSA